MALPASATMGAVPSAGATAGAGVGTLISNPVGWLGLGASLLMSLDAQDKANAAKTEAYKIRTSNLMMERDQRLMGERHKVLAAQDQIVEGKLQNMIKSMETSAKVKSASKSQSNIRNVMRVINANELRNDTKLSKQYDDMINAYDTQSENIYKRTKARLNAMRYEYATQDNTLPLLFNTAFQGLQFHRLDLREQALDESNKKLQDRIDAMLKRAGA